MTLETQSWLVDFQAGAAPREFYVFCRVMMLGVLVLGLFAGIRAIRLDMWGGSCLFLQPCQPPCSLPGQGPGNHAAI